eukprot:Ihof_evm4s46 gene=Ihof_evmTU4s46
MSIGVPVKLLHESQGHIITIEMKTGELYRGKLAEAEDNFNCLMGEVTVTGRDGKVSKMEHAYLRGSKIRFLVIPDMLKNAPFFKRVKGDASGMGRGKTAILRAQ